MSLGWGDLGLALGFVLVIEGLVLALAPRRIEDALRVLTTIPPEARRMIGLAGLALGVGLLWLQHG